jgi:hypothetical protein
VIGPILVVAAGAVALAVAVLLKGGKTIAQHAPDDDVTPVMNRHRYHT